MQWLGGVLGGIQYSIDGVLGGVLSGIFKITNTESSPLQFPHENKNKM